MSHSIQAACCQFLPTFGATGRNLEFMANKIGEAKADLIVFPELCTSGYEIRDRNDAKSLALGVENGSEFQLIKSLATQYDKHVVFGFPETSNENVFNSASLIEPDGRVTTYRKLHLFDREKNLFDPGDAEPPVIDTRIGKIGLMICFDWIFPEVARVLALKGAQIICHPSNLVLTYCQQAMFARSVENGVFTMTCNRIGSETRTDRTLTFTGGSQILSNKGATLAKASSDSEETISAMIEPELADNKMITAQNDRLGDRRTEFYHQLIK